MEEELRRLRSEVGHQNRKLDQIEGKIDKLSIQLLEGFDQQSRLIVKAVNEKAPRYMVLLPVLEEATGDDMLSRLKHFGKLTMARVEGLVKQKAELWLLCEGRLAGIDCQCAKRQPIVVDRYNDWILQAAPYLKYVALALSLAAKAGTGLNVLDAAGVDVEALGALATAFDGVKDGKAEVTVKETMGQMDKAEMQKYLEAATEEGSDVQVDPLLGEDVSRA